MRNLNDAIQYEKDMVAEGWEPVRHDNHWGEDHEGESVFEQLQVLHKIVEIIFDDEDASDGYTGIAFALSKAISRLSTTLGFPATEFLRSSPVLFRNAA